MCPIRSSGPPAYRPLPASPSQTPRSASTAPGLGSAATAAPLMAPTDVPTTTSGTHPGLEQRLQHADLAGAEQPTAAEHERDLVHLGTHPPILSARLRAAMSSSRSSTVESLRSPSWPSSLVTQQRRLPTRSAVSTE